jgi:hypothetical protein
MLFCPKCYSNRICRSHRHGLDWILTLLLLLPYRCEVCRHRFYRFRFMT